MHRDTGFIYFMANSVLTSQRSEFVDGESGEIIEGKMKFFTGEAQVGEFLEKCELLTSDSEFKRSFLAHRNCEDPGKVDYARKMKVVIIGATGATGRELVRNLARNPLVGRIKLITRRVLPEWSENPEIESKLEILQLENYDSISHFSNSNHLQGYDAFICALGSRVGRGTEEFEKVDYTYVTDSAVMAINAGIPHFSVVSTVGADPDSWFLYLRTKGLADEYLKNLKMPYLSIYRPGPLLDRENDYRWMESIMKWIPFGSKIGTKDLSIAIMNDLVDYWKEKLCDANLRRANVVWSNDELVTLSQMTKN